MLEAIRAVVTQADLFYDVQIRPGDSISDTLLERLNEASIVLFCLSPDALKSRYCQREMEIGLRSTGKRLVPIILKPCDWATSPLARFMALPSDAKPVSTWKNPEHAISDIARAVKAIVVSPAPQAHPSQSGHTDRVRRIAINPRGTRAVSASDDGTAVVWDLATLQPTAVMRHRGGPVTDVLLSNDDTVVTANGNELCHWDLRVGTLLGRAPTETPADAIVSISEISGGTLVATSKHVVLMPGGDALTVRAGSPITTVAGSKSGNRWVAGFADGDCDVYEGSELAATAKVAKAPIVQIHAQRFADGLRYVSCSADGHLQVMTGGPGHVRDFLVSAAPLSGIAPMPDGKCAAVAAFNAIKLIDLSTGAILREWPFANDPPTAIAVTPDGARIVWGTASGVVSARSIDLTTQRPLPVGEDRLRLAYLAVLELPELWAVLESLDESALAGVGSQLQLGPDQDVLQALQSRRPGIEPPPLWMAWMTSLYPSKVGKPQGPR